MIALSGRMGKNEPALPAAPGEALPGADPAHPGPVAAGAGHLEGVQAVEGRGAQAAEADPGGARLIFAGYEFCDQVDPFEAAIGFTVPLKTKEDDFVGREALLRRKASPSAPWSAWNWTATRPRDTVTACTSGAPRSA
jgi:hypothetical protein